MSGRPGLRLVLAHGAGAPMDSPFMETLAVALEQGGLPVVRFEFPYMAARRRDGRRRPPDREPVLRQAWREQIQALGPPQRLVIGGKSLGGRMASLEADAAGVAGLVCLGYPFHPPGRPERTRIEHLRDLQTRTLILQGERDPLGRPEEVARYPLSPAVKLVWLPDGDHSFKPRRASGHTEQGNLEAAAQEVLEFVSSLPGPDRT